MAITLTKVNITNLAYFHVFERLDKTRFEVETTEANYKQLATPSHKDPTQPDAKWRCSYAFYKLDTASGKLEHGQYVDEFTKQYWLCLNDVIDIVPKDKLAQMLDSASKDTLIITDPILTTQIKDTTWL